VISALTANPTTDDRILHWMELWNKFKHVNEVDITEEIKKKLWGTVGLGH